MSGSLTLTAGQVFTGGTTLSDGDTGMIALTEVGTVTFNTVATPPTISNVTITKDANASSISDPNTGAVIQSVTIDSVNTDSVVTLTTNDLPPGITVPPGFTLPQNVQGTTFTVTVATNEGTFTGTAGLYGTDGPLALVAVQSIVVFPGETVDAGAAILSLGTQATGDGLSQSFTPAFSASAPCFAAGTRIRTPAAEVAVEALRIGDRVSQADGTAAPVVWLGHRRVDCERHPRPWDVWRVRIAAGAFGPGAPLRDLLLSPDHAVFVEGVLIPVRYLVNGATVVQQPVAQVEYWHVELPRHGVLLAEGLACESYLDTGNRAAFANAGPAMQMHAEFARERWDAEGCAPLVLDGPHLAAARQRLLARATALGHAMTADPGLRVLADGRELAASVHGRHWLARLPEGTRSVRLASRVWHPAHMRGETDDTRALGVAIARLWLDGREVGLDSPGLRSGWHAVEPECRWTDGDATLAVAGAREVAFELAMTGTYWRGGAAEAARAA